MAGIWTPNTPEPSAIQSGIVGVVYPLFKIISPANNGTYSENFFFHNQTNPNLFFGLTIAEHPEINEIWFFGTPTIAGYGEFQVENSRTNTETGLPDGSLFHTFSLMILPPATAVNLIPSAGDDICGNLNATLSGSGKCFHLFISGKNRWGLLVCNPPPEN